MLVGGMFGTAFVFAASNYAADIEKDDGEYFSIADDAQRGLDISGSITIELWVKPESLPQENEIWPLAAKWEYAPIANRSYTLLYWGKDGDADYLRFQVSDDGTTESGHTAHHDYTVGDLPTDAWTHLAVSYDAESGDGAWYVNGNAVAAFRWDVKSIYDSSSPFLVGHAQGVDYYDGLIDEVRVWSGARSADEIKSDYARELYGVETGLAGYWKMNEFSDGSMSVTRLDATENGNDLENHNTVASLEDTPFPASEEPDNVSPALLVRKSDNAPVEVAIPASPAKPKEYADATTVPAVPAAPALPN